MVAKGGAKLLRDEAIDAICTLLLPLAAIITRSLSVAEVLLGRASGPLPSTVKPPARARALWLSSATTLMRTRPRSIGTAKMVELSALRISRANTRGAIEFAIEPGQGRVPVTPTFGLSG